MAIKFFSSNDLKDPTFDEIAVAESDLYGQFGFTPYNPNQLVQRKGGLQIYDKMKKDDQVKAGLLLKKQAVLASGWTVQPADEDDPASVKISDFVNECFNQMSGSLTNALFRQLSALEYGYSITEIIWKPITLAETGETKIGIKALKSKKPHDFDFEIDEFANLLPNGLLQTSAAKGQIEHLPINKFLIYTYQKEFGNWYGNSDLNAAYRNWWSKDNIVKFWNMYLERFGMPPVIGEYMATDKGVISNLKNIIGNFQSKMGIAYRKGDFELKLLEAQRQGTANYENALSYHDKAISNALLIPGRVKDDGEGGARAEASVRFDVFLWTIELLRGELEEIVMTEQLIRRLVDFNFAGVSELPKFKFNPLTKEQKMELAKLYIEAVSKGAATTTVESENALREILSMPDIEEKDFNKAKEASKPKPKPAPGEDPKKEDEEKDLKTLTERTPLPREQGINFTEIDTSLKDIELKTIEKLQTTLTKQRDTLTGFITTRMTKGELTMKLARDITLKFTSELKSTIKEMYDESYALGITDGRQEIARLNKKFSATTASAFEIEPTEAIAHLHSKSDFVVKGIKDPLLAETQRTLVNAIKEGTPIPVTIKQLQEAYIPYLADGDVIIDDKQLQPYRLEAIVRTSTNEAYNWGRRTVGEDPELEGFVVGYQFSEILDERTVAISQFVDGKVISLDSPALATLSYPLHWNERGIFIYATAIEGPVTFMDETQIGQAVAMKGI